MHLFFGSSYEMLSIKLREEATKQESQEPREEQRARQDHGGGDGIKLSRQAGGQPGPWGQKAHETVSQRHPWLDT